MKLLKKLRKTVVKSMIRRQKQRQPFSKGRLAVWGHKMTVTSVNKDVDIDGLNEKKAKS